MDEQEVWNVAKVELQNQMTKATFETWVRPTRAIGMDEQKIVIFVHSTYAKEWLENRLFKTIQATVAGITGKSLKVKFVATVSEMETYTSDVIAAKPVVPPSTVEAAKEIMVTVATMNDMKDYASDVIAAKPDDVIVRTFDDPHIPFIQVQKYAILYWMPLIGNLALAVWEILRTMDKQNEGIGKRHPISVELIAATTVTNRQAITGCQRKEGWQDGAFDFLNREKLALIERIGQNPATCIWYARVRNHVPLLTPQQVARLPEIIQMRHTRFLRESDIAFEDWQQLKLASLIPSPEGKMSAGE